MTLVTDQAVAGIRFTVELRKIGPSTWVYRIVNGAGTVKQTCHDPHIAIVACDAMNQKW